MSPTESSPQHEPRNAPPRKAGAFRLAVQWALTQHPGVLFLLLLGGVPLLIKLQQPTMLLAAFAVGAFVDAARVWRVVAFLALVFGIWYCGRDFGTLLAWTESSDDMSLRVQQGMFAVAVGFPLGLVVGGVARWLLHESDGDPDDEDDEPIESFAQPTIEGDDDRTILHETGSRDAAPPDAIPDLGNYEVLTELGRGGMGVVYKARHRSLGRVVALKTTLERTGSASRAIERFRGEAESVARLDHPGIVPVYEFGEHDGRRYFTMGFVDGPSLAARLASGPVEPAVAVLIVRQAAEAVAFAHARGVIHRDIKPGNILLDPGGDARVTDFGLARRIDLNEADDVGADAAPFPDTHQTVRRLTATGTVFGTPAYMAPEQALDAKRVGPAADIWALGTVLYACLTGRPPFHGASVAETLSQVIEANPPRPRELVPSLDRELEAICLKCLQKDPNRRYRSATDLADDLARWQSGLTPRAARIGLLERLHRGDAKWPEALPILAGLAAERFGNVQEGIFVGCVLSGARLTRWVPRSRMLVAVAAFWAALVMVIALMQLGENEPITDAQRQDWQRQLNAIEPDLVRTRSEYQQSIAAKEVEAEAKLQATRRGVALSALAGALLGTVLAIGARSVFQANPGSPGYVVLYQAALLVPMPLCMLMAALGGSDSIVQRLFRDGSATFGFAAGWLFVVPLGLAVGVLIHGSVRQLAGPTRAGARSADFAARLGMAVAAVGVLAAVPHLLPIGPTITSANIEMLGPSSLLAASERWAAVFRDELGIRPTWPVVFLTKFVSLGVPMAVTAGFAAILLRGRKLT